MLGGAVAMSAGSIALLEAEPIERAYFLPPRGGWANRASWELVLAEESLRILNEKLGATLSSEHSRGRSFHEFTGTDQLALYGMLQRRARAVERVEKLLKGWVPPPRKVRTFPDGHTVHISGGVSRALLPSDLGPSALPWNPKAGWRAV